MELGRYVCPNQWLLDIGYVANASIIFDDVKDDCTLRCFKVTHEAIVIFDEKITILHIFIDVNVIVKGAVKLYEFLYKTNIFVLFMPFISHSSHFFRHLV